jgi:hypothetical protein
MRRAPKGESRGQPLPAHPACSTLRPAGGTRAIHHHSGARRATPALIPGTSMPSRPKQGKHPLGAAAKTKHPPNSEFLVPWYTEVCASSGRCLDAAAAQRAAPARTLKVFMSHVSCFPVSRCSLPVPYCAMCSACVLDSFTMASSMACGATRPAVSTAPRRSKKRGAVEAQTLNPASVMERRAAPNGTVAPPHPPARHPVSCPMAPHPPPGTPASARACATV